MTQIVRTSTGYHSYILFYIPFSSGATESDEQALQLAEPMMQAVYMYSREGQLFL